ncbi:MAG: response regulator [Candidatus Desulfaltia sp.]|nr:response regulator [Candidatus Desulfaltia sp.]
MPKEKKVQENSIRVLLVDDEKEYVKVLSNRLTLRNIDVTKTYSGSEALQVLRKQDFDVAVLDIKMEDMDGLELLKILKKMAPQIEVIMLTGHGSAEESKQGMKLGAYNYLIKPCEFEDLLDKIKGAYQKSHLLKL